MVLPSLCYSGDGLSRPALAGQLVICVAGHIEADCGDWDHPPASRCLSIFCWELDEGLYVVRSPGWGDVVSTKEEWKCANIGSFLPLRTGRLSCDLGWKTWKGMAHEDGNGCDGVGLFGACRW
jgi:hypothetical protein